MRFYLLLTLLAAPAAAQDNQVSIRGGQASGAIAVNGVAGNGNAQTNAGVIAAGRTALATGTVDQVSDNASGSSVSARATIAGDAFLGSSGWLAISGAAGNDNQQANVAAIAFGSEAGALGDLVLSQSRASQQPSAPTGTVVPTTERSAEIGDGAFGGSSGLVQVSLIGGDRNTSANSFALSMSGRSDPSK